MPDSNAEFPTSTLHEQIAPYHRTKRHVSTGRSRIATQAKKAIAIATTATELLSVLPARTGPKPYLGPIWKPKDSLSLSIGSENKGDQFDPRFYDVSTQGLPPKNNGEVKTPYGNLPIEGMAVVANPSAITVPKDKIMEITTVEPPANTKGQWEYGGSEVIDPKSNEGIDNLIEATKTHPLSWELSGKDDELPISGDEGGYVSIQLYNDKTGAEESSKLYPETFSPHEPTAFGSPIISEVNSPQVVKEIAQTLALFKPFLRHKIRFVLHQTPLPNDTHWDDFENPRDTVQLALPEYKSIKGYDLNSEIRYHELVHAIYKGLDEHAKDQLRDAYNILVANMTYRMPTDKEMTQAGGYDVLGNEPIWRPITELTYNNELGFKNSEAGHPYDPINGKGNEAFASTLNVLRHFSSLFLEQYAQLQDNKRFAICNFVVTAIDSLRSVNKNKADMQKLLPDVDKILKNFEADPANAPLKTHITTLINET